MAKDRNITEMMAASLGEKTRRVGPISRDFDESSYDPMGNIGGVSASESKARKRSVVEEKQEETRRMIKENRAPIVGRGRKREERCWPAEQDYHTSIVFNSEQYQELTEVAYQLRKPVKEVMYECIAIGLEKVKKRV